MIEVLQKVPRVALGTSLVLSQGRSPIDSAAKFGPLAHRFPARELADAAIR